MSTFIGMGATGKVASNNFKEIKILTEKVEELESNLTAVTNERDELKSKVEELESNLEKSIDENTEKENENHEENNDFEGKVKNKKSKNE